MQPHSLNLPFQIYIYAILHNSGAYYKNEKTLIAPDHSGEQHSLVAKSITTMATAMTATPWTDTAVQSPHLDMGKTRNRLNPHTPLPSSTRRVSGKRKRNCDSSDAVGSTPFTGAGTPASMATSPSPLVNEKYDLDRGADTPGPDNTPGSPDLESYRTHWAPSGALHGDHPALSREGNGRPRGPVAAPPPARRVWTVGGMVGKVASFCASMLPHPPPSKQGDIICPTPRIPGMYPEDQMERPRKRLHLVEDENDWVVIAAPEGWGSPASKASVRRTAAGAPRGRKSLVPLTGSPAGSSPRRRVSVAGLRARRSQPVLRRRVSGLGLQEEREEEEEGERLTPEARRMVAKREREERDADKSVRKMSRTIQELIRQGQVALESSFEIEEGSEEE